MTVAGTTSINGGEIIVTSAVDLGTVTGEGTLSINWDANTSHSYTFDNLHTLNICKGTYGSAADKAALDVRNIIVQSGASYVQGQGVRYGGHIIAEGGTITLNAGALTGSLTVNTDSYLNVAAGVSSKLDVGYMSNNEAELIQIGGGTVTIVERGQTQLDHYVVREGTLEFAGWCTHTQQGVLTVESGAKLTVAWGAGLEAELINLKSGATLQLANGANAWWLRNHTTANILVEDNATIAGSAYDDLSYIQGTISGSGTLNLANAASVTGAKAYRIDSIISDGSGSLGLNIANTSVTLTGANSYTSGTVIDAASTVTTAHAMALGSGTVQNAGALVMNNNLSIGGISGSGSLDIGTYVLVLNNDTDKVYTGEVTGKGGILQAGTGSSTFTSAVDLAAVGVQAGHLVFSGPSIGISTEAYVAAGAELSLSGEITLGAIIENEGTVHLAGNTTFNLQFRDFTDNSFTMIGGTGSITYADALMASDITVEGYTLTDLLSNGVTYNLVQTASTLQLTLDNVNRPLVWTGEAGSEWNRADGNWSHKGENGAIFNLLDMAIFDDTAAVKDVTVVDTPFASSMTVSGTGYSFTGALNVSGAFLVESGASATLNTAPAYLGQATVKGDLTLAFGDTWTQDVDASAGTIHKVGTGTLTWDPAGGILQIGTLDVQKGCFMSSSAMEIGTFSLGTGAVALLTNTTTADAAAKNIQQVLMGNNSYFCIQDSEASSTKTAIGEVVMMGAKGEFQDYALGENSYIGIDKLSLGAGITTSTLTLSAMPQKTNTTVYELGFPSAEAGNFAGTIVLKGNYAHAALILSGAQVAAQAVIDLNASLSTYHKKALGINVDNAEIAGLASAQSMGTETKLFSGTVSATQAFNTANITNAATRNLTINTASGTSYTFYGEVMQGVNLTKTGAGTQAFAGTVDSAAVAVLGGTLDMTAATLANGALADVTLHRGGTLQLGSLNVASGNSLTVQGTGMDATATLSGNLVLGGGNLNFVGTTLDTTSAALTVGGSVSLTGNQTITLTDYLGLVAGNSYFLIAGNFVEGITADNFTLSSLQDGYNGSLSIENGGLWLNLAGAANASIWAGNTASYTWSATTYGSVNSSLLGNQTATFDDSAINRNVLVDGQVTAAGGMVFNNNADYTVGFSNINSSLTTPTVTLNGEGTVNMQVALNTDALTVNNGKLVLSDYAVLDSDTAVKLTGDAVMDITSTTQTFTNLSLAAGTRIEDTRGTGTLNLVAAEGSAMALAGEVNVGTIGTQGEVSLTVGVNTHTLVLGDTTLTLNNALVLNANRTISVQGDAVLNAAVTMAGGTLLFDNAVLSDTEAALDMGTAPTKANGGVKIAVSDLGALSDGGTFVLASGDWSAFSASDFSLIGTVYSSNLASFVIQENALVMNLTAHGVWAGTEDAYTWNSSTFGPDKALASTAMAIFDNSAEHKTVSLTESVTVGDILVDSNRAYSITPTQSGLSITGEDFTKQGSGTLEIGVDVQLSGNMTLQGGDVHFAGTTQVSGSVTQSKGSVTFSGDNTTLGDYTINSASTLNIDGSNATLGNLNLVRTGGDTIYINFAGGSASMGSINMGQNALLSFQKPEGSSSAEYSVNGEIFFSLNVWGGASTAIQVDKGVKVTVDSIRNSWGMGGINIDGEMEVKGELLLSSGSDDPITGSGKLTASRLTLTNTGTYVIDVAEVTVSDQMLVNWSRKSILRSGVLTSESSFKQTSATFALEGGSLNLNGTSSFTGGTLQFAGGEMNVQSGTANLANTVEAVNGSVKVTGGDLLLNATTARNLLEGIDKFTMTSGSLDLADVVFGADGANAITLKNGALFTFTGGVVELGNLQQGTTYQIFDTETHGGSLSGWTSLTKENFTLNGMLMSDLGRVDLVLGETGSLSYAQAIYDLVWTGSAGSNAWNATDANWTHTPDDTTDADIAFANGDSVTFASHATVSVAEGVRVNNLALAENVTLTTTDALNVAGSITAGTGSKWTLDGSTTAFTQSLTGAQVDDLKALEVGAGATLQVSGVQGGFTASNISGTGTVELTLTKEYADYDNSLKLAGFEGEVYVKDGKFDLYDALGSNGVTQLGSKLHLGADVHMQIESGKPVIVDEDVLLDASATNMQVHQNGGATLTYTGSVSGERAYEHRGKGTLTFSGDVDLAGFVQTHDSNAVNIFQGASTQIDTLTQGNAITRFNSASATIGTLKLTGGTIQVQGGQLAIDAVHADTTGGTLQVTGGALNFGAGAAQALLGKVSSFTLSSGPLDLADVTFGTDSSNAIVLKSGANFTFTGGIIALGEMQENTVYRIFDATNGTLSGWTTLDKSNFTVNGSALTSLGRVQLSLGERGTFSYSILGAQTITWVGGSSTEWNTTDANWDFTPDADAANNEAFYNGDSVIFNTDANVTVTEAVSANNLTVRDDATVSITETAALRAQSIEVQEGATLAFASTKNGYTAANISGDGTVELKLSNNYDNAVRLEGFDGELYVNSGRFDLYTSTAEHVAGSVTADDDSDNVAQLGTKLHVGQGVNMKLTSGKTVVMDADMVLSAGNHEIHHNGGAILIVNGDVTGEGTWVHKGTNGTLTFSETGSVTLGGFSTGSAGTISFNATTTLGTANLTQGAVTFANTTDIGSATISGGTMTFNGVTTLGAVTISGGTTTFANTADITTATITGGTVNFNGATDITTATLSGGTLNVGGEGKLDVDRLTVNGDVSIANSKLNSASLLERDLGSVSIAEGKTLTLWTTPNGTVNENAKAAVTWTVESLSGAGTLKWDSWSYHDFKSSQLVLKGDGSGFTGEIFLNRRFDTRNGPYQTYLVLASDDAAKKATVRLKGNAANGTASLAVNTANANVGGLISDTAHAHLYAGAAPSTHNAGQQASTAANTLTITGAGEYTFSGTVGKSGEHAHLNLAMTGTGSQTFSGVAHVGDVSVSNGTLALSNTNSKVYGDITVSGGSLTFAGSYTLGEGQVLSVLTGTQNAVLLGGLTLSGGELAFDASLLSTNTAALSLGSAVVYTAGTTQSVMLDFSKLSGDLATGSYLLAGGDWSGENNTTLAYNGMGAASLEATANGLYLHYTHGGIYTWVGGAENTNWSAANWDVTPDTNADNNVSFAAGKDVIFNTNANVMVDTAVVVGVATVQNGAQVTLDKSGDSASLTAESVVVQDGKLTLGGGKNWTGISEVTVLADGVLELAHLSTVTGADIILRGGEMQLLNGAWSNYEAVADILVDGSGSIRGSFNGDNSKLSGTISGVGTLNFHAYNTYWNNPVTVSSLISDGAAGPLSLHVTNGTVKLTGTNTYTGATTVSGGTLELAHAGALNSHVTVNAGALFRLEATSAKTFAKTISGAGSVEKTGAGTLTLTGANTYTGATTVSGGTLELTGTVSMAAGSSISLANGTTLLLNTTNATAMTLGNDITGTGTIHKKGGYETVLSGNIAANLITVRDYSTGNNGENLHNAGVLTLTGDTVTANQLYLAYGTLNIGGTAKDDTTFMAVQKVEIGDSNQGDATTELNVRAGATLTVTGDSNGTGGNTGHKNASFLLAEWLASSTLNVAGKVLVPKAKAVFGDDAGTININGGILAVQGISEVRSGHDNTGIALNLSDNGKLIMGEPGLQSSKPVTAQLGTGTVGMFADTTTIAENVTLTSAEGTTFDTTQYTFVTNTDKVATGIERGTEAGSMTVTGDITSAADVAAKMKVAGNGELLLTGNANVSGGLEVEKGAVLTTAALAMGSTAGADSTAAAVVKGAVSISATEGTARIEGTDDAPGRIDNSLITLAQGASLTVDNMIISESSRISGKAAAATFAARQAATPNVTLTNSTIELGHGNAELTGGGAPITINPGKLTSMDGSATDVWMTGAFTALRVESSALDSLTLNAGSSFLVDFSSLLADVSIDNIDLIELSFSGVAFDSMSDITISGVYNGHQMTAYYLTPADTAVANVGSVYFAVDAIPEPTTSTLSLLALAALAARRRRK
ncbi:MAG: autotransporter-associated beta strand repeat-containing protein [Akkermansia sp.]|nr:autotransporter-associated beta strand repeat-containing protein [Akkermansia sp.]